MGAPEAGVGDLVAPKIEVGPAAILGGPPKTGADPKADEVLADPPKIEAKNKIEKLKIRKIEN